MRNLAEGRRLLQIKERSKLDNLSKKYDVDRGVVEYIVRYPFVYLRRMVSSNDTRPVRLRYLGVFYLKKEDSKKTHVDNILNRLYKIPEDVIIEGMCLYFNNNFNNIDEVNSFIKSLYDSKDFVSIDNAYKLCRRLKKSKQRQQKM